jgi:NAD(P)-dependent dehydrogenase (short-subunit alcohol dehydrogenase family)
MVAVMARPPVRPVAGRVVAVTGGARGIGAATAQALAQKGARVAIGDLDAGLAEATAARIGREAVGLRVDVTDSASFRTFLEEVERRLGPLDVLVNNAGVMWVGAFEQEPEDAALRQFDVNFHGVVRGMKLAIPGMRRRGGGHVVNVASVASKLPPAGEASYAASKHAVYGYSMAVRQELRGTGVDLSVVMPVVVETELAAGTGQGRSKRLQPEEVAEAVVGALERPRFDVFVPRSIAGWSRVLEVLPQPGRDLLYRTMMPDQVKETDQEAREGYEQRAVKGTAEERDGGPASPPEEDPAGDPEPDLPPAA